MTEIANTLTNKEYVKNLGQVCPVCESLEIEGDSFEVDGGAFWQQIRCNVCDSQWSDYYRLVEYEMDESNSISDARRTLKTFDSGVLIANIGGNKVVYVKTKGKVMWFTTLDSPRIKRIKDKKVREDVVQALHEIKLIEKLE